LLEHPEENARDYVEKNNLRQVTDVGAIEKIVDDIIAKNPDKVADAKTNPKAIGWFVGQVMKSSGGKASPPTVMDLLKRKLGLSLARNLTARRGGILRLVEKFAGVTAANPPESLGTDSRVFDRFRLFARPARRCLCKIFWVH